MSTDNKPKPTYYTNINQVNSICDKVIPKTNADDDMDELFTVNTAGNWLKQANKRAVPKMLFGKFWYETELCILFADSNLGKSILAVQIADAIAEGYSIEPFICEAEPQPVLYFDFELTDKQFEARYSIDYENHYPFTDKFYRAEMNPGSEIPKGFKDFDDYLNHALERSIVQTGAKILVIDNLTYLRSENERAKDALPLMKHLKALKNKYGLSILALAHTPKRDMSQELNRNDLQGSKMLMNFCDSAFAIGESVLDKGMRYLKQIKQRNTDQVYGTDNVCICVINKPSNFLKYEFTGYGVEADHLRKPKYGKGNEHMDEVLKLREEGLTLKEIGAKFGLSFQQVDRLIKKAER
jgi:hypothetical protein